MKLLLAVVCLCVATLPARADVPESLAKRKLTDIEPGLYYLVKYGDHNVSYMMTVNSKNELDQGAPEYFVATPDEARYVSAQTGAKPLLPDPSVYYPGEPGPFNPYVQTTKAKALGHNILNGTSSLLKGTTNALTGRNQIAPSGSSGTTNIYAPAPFIPPQMNFPRLPNVQQQQFRPLPGYHTPDMIQN